MEIEVNLITNTQITNFISCVDLTMLYQVPCIAGEI